MDINKMPNLLSPIRQAKRRKVGWRTKLLVVGGALILVGVGLYFSFRGAVDFFDGYTFVFRPMIEVQVNQPVSVIERRPRVETVVQIINALEPLDSASLPIEKYICEKFGAYDCKTAIAIARAESGMREDAIHANTNGTVDIGIFQINSVHFSKIGCSLKELAVAESNVDCAYLIWERQGWKPWAVYGNGAFTKELNAL